MMIIMCLSVTLRRGIVCSVAKPGAVASVDPCAVEFYLTDSLKGNLMGLSTRLAADEVLARWLADRGELRAPACLHITMIQCVFLINSFFSAST